ncbi:hypothetical protein SO802_028430, partial [Lithocarpus litseifolius]
MERHLRPAQLSDSNHQKFCIPQPAVHCYRVTINYHPLLQQSSTSTLTFPSSQKIKT